MKTINRLNLKDFIRQTNGKAFRVDFVKNDGSERRLIARTITVKKKSNRPYTKNLATNTYMSLWSFDKQGWRSINLATVKTIKANKNTYEVK